MKHLLLILVVIGAVFSTHSNLRAQAHIADTIIHYGEKDAVLDMLVCDNGDAILVGKMDTTTGSLTPKNIWVQRLGIAFGDSLNSVVSFWEKTYMPLKSRVSSAIWTLDSNFVIAGSWGNNSMLLKMSPEGDSLDMILTPGNEFTYYKDVIQLPDSDFILLEVNVQEDLYGKLLRMNKNGTILWEEEYDDRYYSSIGYYTPDSFMVAGYEYHQEYQHLLFGSNNTNGLPYFSNMYQWVYGWNNCMATDSGVIYLGNSKEYLTSPDHVAQLMKMSSDGEVEWALDYSDIGSEVINDIHIYDNYLLTLSEEVTFNYSLLIMAAVTPDGAPAPAYYIPMDNPTGIAIDTYDKRVYITGRIDNGLNGKDIFFVAYYLDSLWIINAQEEHLTEKAKVLVYPNPVNSLLNIQTVDMPTGSITKVGIYNLMGKLEKEIEVDPYSNPTVSVADLPEGMYLVLVHLKDGTTATNKVLVDH